MRLFRIENELEKYFFYSGCIEFSHFFVQIHYWCTALMWKIVNMPIVDWLPYLLHCTLILDLDLGIKSEISHYDPKTLEIGFVVNRWHGYVTTESTSSLKSSPLIAKIPGHVGYVFDYLDESYSSILKYQFRFEFQSTAHWNIQSSKHST